MVKKLNKTQVIEYYGSKFTNTNEGILYKRAQSSWPQFAFFFDQNEEIVNQFALVDELELEELKTALDCNWKESTTRQSTPHAVYDIKSGICDKYSVKYHFRSDLNLYELRWIKN